MSALGVLPWTHLDGELLQQEAANAFPSSQPPIVIAKVSRKGGNPAQRRGSAEGGAALAAVASAALVLAVALSSSSPSSPLLLRSSSSSSSPSAPPPPPPPPLLPLPGNAPNCFGGAECVRGLMRPLPSAAADDPADPADPASAAAAAAANTQPSLLDLVPRVVHMTVEDRSKIPCHMFPSMRSWLELNPGWRLWIWDRQDRDRLIAQAFPRWRPYFDALAEGVERADLFKYSVLSALGGVYSDIDVECKLPISEWARVYGAALGNEESGKSGNRSSSSSAPRRAGAPAPPAPASALILGVEALHDEADTYRQAKHVYPVQLSAWTILSSPGHPALGPVGDALFAASQAETARELLALFSPTGAVGGGGGGENEEEKRELALMEALGLGGSKASGDFDEAGDDQGGDDDNKNKNNKSKNKMLQRQKKKAEAAARLWYRESILNRTGPFLLSKTVLRYASERLEPALHLDTHEDAADRLRNEDGYVGVAAGGSSSSAASSAAAAVAILPLDAFGSGQPHSRAGPVDGPGVLAVHKFLSSWRGSGDGQDDGYWCEWK